MPFKRRVGQGTGDILNALLGTGNSKNELAGALAANQGENMFQKSRLNRAKADEEETQNLRLQDLISNLATSDAPEAKGLLQALMSGGNVAQFAKGKSTEIDTVSKQLGLTQLDKSAMGSGGKADAAADLALFTRLGMNQRDGFNIFNDIENRKADVLSTNAQARDRNANANSQDFKNEQYARSVNAGRGVMIPLPGGGEIDLATALELGSGGTASGLFQTQSKIDKNIAAAGLFDKKGITEGAKVSNLDQRTSTSLSKKLNIELDTLNDKDFAVKRLTKIDEQISNLKLDGKNKVASGELSQANLEKSIQQLKNAKAKEKLIQQQIKTASARAHKLSAEGGKTRNVLSQNQHLIGMTKTFDRLAETNPRIGGTVTKKKKNGEEFTRDRFFKDMTAREQSEYAITEFNETILPAILKPLPDSPVVEGLGGSTAEAVPEEIAGLVGALDEGRPSTDLSELNTEQLQPADVKFLNFLEQLGATTREQIENLDLTPDRKDKILDRFDKLMFESGR